METTWWLLTTTTYGTWLPGNERGSVTHVRDRRDGEIESQSRRKHVVPGDDYEPSMPGLLQSAVHLLKGPAVVFELAHAEAVLEQLQETATYRGWTLDAVSIMPTHFHAVTEATANVAPDKLLGDYKAYASRKLNRIFGRPTSGEWWTDKGSKRPLKTDRSVENATNYVLYHQSDPIVVWSRKLGRLK